MRFLIGLLYLFYGTADGDAAGEDVMLHHALRSKTFANDTSFNETLKNSTQPVAQPVLAQPDDGSSEGDGTDKSIFMLGILISFCIVAVLGVTMTVICWVR